MVDLEEYKWPNCLNKFKTLLTHLQLLIKDNNYTSFDSIFLSIMVIDRIISNYKNNTKSYNIVVYPGMIEQLQVDCIVIDANKNLEGTYFVYKKAVDGTNLQKIDINGNIVTTCDPGNAVISKSSEDLKDKGIKYIIYAVGPSCNNTVKNKMSDDEKFLLQSAYQNSLKLVYKFDINSVAFPVISTDINGCNKLEAAKIAVRELTNFVKKNSTKVIIICLYLPLKYEKDEIYISKSNFKKLTVSIVENFALQTTMYFEELDKIYKSNSVNKDLSKILFNIN